MNQNDPKHNPEPGSVEWQREMLEEDINEMMFFDGDEIGAGLGFERDETGNWSDSAAAAILAECRKILERRSTL